MYKDLDQQLVCYVFFCLPYGLTLNFVALDNFTNVILNHLTSRHSLFIVRDATFL